MKYCQLNTIIKTDTLMSNARYYNENRKDRPKYYRNDRYDRSERDRERENRYLFLERDFQEVINNSCSIEHEGKEWVNWKHLATGLVIVKQSHFEKISRESWKFNKMEKERKEIEVKKKANEEAIAKENREKEILEKILESITKSNPGASQIVNHTVTSSNINNVNSSTPTTNPREDTKKLRKIEENLKLQERIWKQEAELEYYRRFNTLDTVKIQRKRANSELSDYENYQDWLAYKRYKEESKIEDYGEQEENPLTNYKHASIPYWKPGTTITPLHSNSRTVEDRGKKKISEYKKFQEITNSSNTDNLERKGTKKERKMDNHINLETDSGPETTTRIGETRNLEPGVLVLKKKWISLFTRIFKNRKSKPKIIQTLQFYLENFDIGYDLAEEWDKKRLIEETAEAIAKYHEGEPMELDVSHILNDK